MLSRRQGVREEIMKIGCLAAITVNLTDMLDYGSEKPSNKGSMHAMQPREVARSSLAIR